MRNGENPLKIRTNTKLFIHNTLNMGWNIFKPCIRKELSSKYSSSSITKRRQVKIGKGFENNISAKKTCNALQEKCLSITNHQAHANQNSSEASHLLEWLWPTALKNSVSKDLEKLECCGFNGENIKSCHKDG